MSDQPRSDKPGRAPSFLRIFISALVLLLFAGAAAHYIPEPQFDEAEREASNGFRNDVVQAIAAADLATRKQIETDLVSWQQNVMTRVDEDFLDSYFSYLNRRSADIKYWWQRLTAGKDVADATYMKDLAALFHEKVMSPEELQSEMENVAARSADIYYDTLVAGLKRVRAQHTERSGWADEHFRQIALADWEGGTGERLNLFQLVDAADENTAAAFKARFKAEVLGARGMRPDELQSLPASAIKVAAVAMLAVKTGTSVAAAVKSLGVAEATAGAIGTATAAVVVVAAIGAQEWWSHKEFVTQQRPKLRREIEIALKSFSDEAAAQDGHFGKGLTDISAGLKRAAKKHRTILALLKSRLPVNMRHILDI